LLVLLVLEDKLDVLVGEGDEVGAGQGSDDVVDVEVERLHRVNPPEEPL
jgi:hypothetical protein